MKLAEMLLHRLSARQTVSGTEGCAHGVTEGTHEDGNHLLEQEGPSQVPWVQLWVCGEQCLPVQEGAQGWSCGGLTAASVEAA